MNGSMKISKDDGLKSLNEAPSYLDSTIWNPETVDRSWEWKIVRGQSKLVYRVASMEIEKSVVRTHRSGFLGRDKIQRAGLASIESRNPDISASQSKWTHSCCRNRDT